MTLKRIYLKKGREKSILSHHPWIFSGAVDRVDAGIERGETVIVCDSSGIFLAQAAYSPQSAIRARIWSWDEKPIGTDFFRDKLDRALSLRSAVVRDGETDALRLVHGESDGLPGFVVDRYADWLVIQTLSAGAEYWKKDFVEALCQATGFHQVYERSDVDVRELEGLEPCVGLIRGRETPDPILIRENSQKLRVSIVGGQKTGFYIDQRENRKLVGELAAGREVLNCFCYTGGFSVYALAGGARSMVSVDSSADALKIARENFSLNGHDPETHVWVEGDVFRVLREMRDRRQSFDMIILDPPKFAPTVAQAERAARGYKDINLLAFKLLRPGGILATFSCSGGISSELFQKIIAGAAQDAGVSARIFRHFNQGVDHPVGLNFPEGAYLKGLAVQVE